MAVVTPVSWQERCAAKIRAAREATLRDVHEAQAATEREAVQALHGYQVRVEGLRCGDRAADRAEAEAVLAEALRALASTCGPAVREAADALLASVRRVS